MADPRLVRQLIVIAPGLGVSQLPRAAETIAGLNAQSLENRKLDYSSFPVAASGALTGDLLVYDGSHWRSQKWAGGPFAVGQAPPVGAVTGQVNVSGPLYVAATSYLQTLIAGPSTVNTLTCTGTLTVSGNAQLGAGLTVYGGTQLTSALSVSGATWLTLTDAITGSYTPVLTLQHLLTPAATGLGLVGGPGIDFYGVDGVGSPTKLGNIYAGTNNSTPGALGTFYAFSTLFGGNGVELLRLKNTVGLFNQAVQSLGSATFASTSGTITLVGPTNANALVAGPTTVNTLTVTGSANLADLTAGPTSVGTLAASGLYVGPLSASGTITGTTALTRAASTGALPAPILHVSNPADTAFPNANYNGDVTFDLGANTRQLLGGGAAISSFDLFQINPGTITALSGQIISAAATVRIVGTPVSGANVSITNACALHVQGRVCFGNNIATSNNAAFTFQQGRTTTQYNMFLMLPLNTGNIPVTTETNLSNWNPNGTVTWNGGGTLTTQRENLYGAPTYAATSATAITNAATLAIAGAPVQGANMTLTNAYALWIQAGGLRCTGHLYCDGGTAPTAASGSAAGTGGVPAPVVTSGANDTRGNITFGSGTAPTSGALVTVTFAAAYGAAPVVLLTQRNNATASLQLFISSTSTTTFSVAALRPPAASQDNTVHSFDYLVLS